MIIENKKLTDDTEIIKAEFLCKKTRNYLYPKQQIQNIGKPPHCCLFYRNIKSVLTVLPLSTMKLSTQNHTKLWHYSNGRNSSSFTDAQMTR